jgi:hypothetical protein
LDWVRRPCPASWFAGSVRSSIGDSLYKMRHRQPAAQRLRRHGRTPRLRIATRAATLRGRWSGADLSSSKLRRRGHHGTTGRCSIRRSITSRTQGAMINGMSTDLAASKTAEVAVIRQKGHRPGLSAGTRTAETRTTRRVASSDDHFTRGDFSSSGQGDTERIEMARL